jgi:peptidoglycan/xylan/chitin deacetylase (PgdA/CDA1 family)
MSNTKERAISYFSLLYHWLNFRLSAKAQRFEKGILITSIDIDVGNHVLGKINKGKNDQNVHLHLSEYDIGKIEELVNPLLVDFFNAMEVPVTFAVRGQLLDVDRFMMDLLLDSPIKHDVGAHGYSHKRFSDLNPKEAENELSMISEGMKRFNVAPKSFVFPRNSIAHLDLLQKHGYLCYRGYGTFSHDGMYIVKTGELYDVHPGLYIDKAANPRQLKALLDICITKKAPFHIWFHPKDFGTSKENAKKNIRRVLHPLFQYAKKKESENLLTFETMSSITTKLKQAHYMSNN